MTKLTDLKRTAVAGPFNRAAELYGVDDLIHTKIPRRKDQFEITFSINGESQEFIFGRVAQVSLPDYDFNVQPLNQYNRLRYYPTRLNPGPISIAFYDTRDSQFQFLLQRYASHYSHGLNVSEQTIISYPTGESNIDRTFGIKAISQSDRFFFEKIEIKTTDLRTTSGENTRTIQAWNCMITNVSHDSLDYSIANPVMWNVQFQPEHVNIFSEGDLENVPAVRKDLTVYEKPVGDTVYAADKDGNFLYDTNGDPVIIRTLSDQGLITPTINGDTTEDGEPLVDESGNPIR